MRFRRFFRSTEPKKEANIHGVQNLNSAYFHSLHLNGIKKDKDECRTNFSRLSLSHVT